MRLSRGCSPIVAGARTTWRIDPSSPRAGCAAPRRRKASARAGAEREVPKPNVVQKREARPGFRLQVARDFRLAALQFQLREEFERLLDRQRGKLGDWSRNRPAQRDGVQALPSQASQAVAVAFEPLVPPDFLAGLLLVEAADLQAVPKHSSHQPCSSCRNRGSGSAKLREHDGHARSVRRSSHVPPCPPRARHPCRIRARGRRGAEFALRGRADLDGSDRQLE